MRLRILVLPSQYGILAFDLLLFVGYSRVCASEHFGSLKVAVSDVWVANATAVISTHTPLLPVRLGLTAGIDWYVHFCECWLVKTSRLSRTFMKLV